MATVTDFYPPSLLKRHGSPALPVIKCSLAGENRTRIDWMPDSALFEERSTNMSFGSGERSKDLPHGWPTQLKGPLVWSGSELQSEEYTYTLSAPEIWEIEHALRTVKGMVLDFDRINKDTFLLPNLGLALENLSHSLHSERGFFVLKGLDPASYSREENVIIYLGITSYVAEKRARQNMSGNKLIHITDVNVPGCKAEARRPIYSSKAQPFHTDVLCNVLSLYHLDTASEGGDNLMASSWEVYNELAAARPDIIKLLAQDDWAHDTYGCNPLYTERPLLFYHDDKAIFNFSRRVLTGAPMSPRSSEIPSLTEAQAEALDTVHFCALKHSLKLRLDKGDMLLANNLAIMHSRTAFRDGETNKRHVLRLWLNNPDKAWHIPPGLELEWARLYEPLDEVEDYYDIDPFNNPETIKDMLSGKTSTKCG